MFPTYPAGPDKVPEERIGKISSASQEAFSPSYCLIERKILQIM
jgi:hypothetical protein